EKAAFSRLPQEPEVVAWVLIEDNVQLDLSFVVLLDPFDRCRLAGQCDIQHVAAGPRTQPDASTGVHLDSVDRHRCDGCLVLEQMPLPLVHFVPSSCAGRSPRSTPCSFITCSSDRLSVRSSIRRARGSASRISHFSYSVIVSLRKTSISSISVPSKKSPGLSCAICGWS